MSTISSGVKYELENLINTSSSYIVNPLIKELFSSASENQSKEYISFLLTTLLYSCADSSHKVETASSDNFNKILDFIEENLSSPLKASQIARHFGYNPAYFSRLFIKRTGMSPMEYIKRQRIFLAKQLLARPYDTINEIGIACGYSDEKYFSRLFKKSEGMTPTQYRNANIPSD